MRLIIVDDDELVSLSLKTILETQEDIEVVATGLNGIQAIELYDRYKPDILLMDIRMPECDGIDAGEKIMATYPMAKILFLTTFSDDEYIVKALRLGAKGYILKQNYKSIIQTINLVNQGQNVYGDEIMCRIPGVLNSKLKHDFNSELTQRENEIIYEVAQGFSNKEIAEKLFLSEGTVRNYISAIFEKLDLRDRTQLAIFYYKNMI